MPDDLHADLVKRLGQTIEWLSGQPFHGANVREAVDALEALAKENFALAAHQCPTAVIGEHGDMVCTKIDEQAKEIERLKSLSLDATQSYSLGILDEREACAKVAGTWTDGYGNTVSNKIAAAIRARGDRE